MPRSRRTKGLNCPIGKPERSPELQIEESSFPARSARRAPTRHGGVLASQSARTALSIRRVSCDSEKGIGNSDAIFHAPHFARCRPRRCCRCCSRDPGGSRLAGQHTKLHCLPAEREVARLARSRRHDSLQRHTQERRSRLLAQGLSVAADQGNAATASDPRRSRRSSDAERGAKACEARAPRSRERPRLLRGRTGRQRALLPARQGASPSTAG